LSNYQRFEDLPVWQKSKGLAVDIYKATNKGEIAKDFSFRDQIRRSTISISSNIAEGFEKGTTREFIRSLFIAKGSAGELRSQLIIAAELDFINHTDTLNFISTTEEISRQLSGYIQSLKAQL
jgi:four helix bundle protein